ncbi:MAG: toll/interleukin-1 receptor domain-containing protein [Bacteroidales bacterium]|nr:toll/interleukin-1 receptor domain-containing protein [Bacteroidales bacterium]
MRIFVSHAIEDNKLISDLKLTLEPHGLELLIAEHYPDIDYSTVTVKIERMIKSCNVALFLLTKNGFNSKFVQQEIGYIKSSRIPYLQVVENGIEKEITGFNFGKGFIQYSPNEPQTALDKVKRFLLNYWKKLELKHQEEQIDKQAKQFQLMIQKQKKREQEVKIGLRILASVLILGLNK